MRRIKIGYVPWEATSNPAVLPKHCVVYGKSLSTGFRTASPCSMKALQKAAILKRVKVFNDIPRNFEDEYARVLFEEYKKTSVKS